MKEEMLVFDIGNPGEMDAVCRRKYDILKGIVKNDALELAKHYGLGLDIRLENDGEKERLYEKHGRWAFGVIDLQANLAKIMFSSKSVRALSDLAFEGLAYHEISETFLTRFAAQKLPMFLIMQETGELPYSTREFFVDSLAHMFFKTKGLVPFRVETANIDYKRGYLDLKFFSDYLSGLSHFLPEAAEEIKEKVDFRDKIHL